MPRMEHVGADKWIKECCRCNTAFEIIAKTFDEAVNLMRRYFSVDRQKYDTLYPSCHSCESARHSGRINEAHRDVMLVLQDNQCHLCSNIISFERKNASVDHDHKTGLTRKILCTGCNTLMSAVDNDTWLAKAIAYRDSYRG